MPNTISPESRDLIARMLAVDPVKRITVPEITQHPWFTPDLPRYLTPLPPPPGPVLGTLSSLVTPANVLDFEIIDGLGRIEDDVVDELASRMVGVEKDDIWEGLRRDDGVQGNAVKVAYLLLRDKRRLGRDREQWFLFCLESTDLRLFQSLNSKSKNEMRSWLLWTYVNYSPHLHDVSPINILSASERSFSQCSISRRK